MRRYVVFRYQVALKLCLLSVARLIVVRKVCCLRRIKVTDKSPAARFTKHYFEVIGVNRVMVLRTDG